MKAPGWLKVLIVAITLAVLYGLWRLLKPAFATMDLGWVIALDAAIILAIGAALLFELRRKARRANDVRALQRYGDGTSGGRRVRE